MAPLLPREHQRQEGAGEVEGGKIRHLDHGSRVLRRGLDQRQKASGAGIVDEDVGRADFARDLGARLFDGFRIGKIDGVGRRASAALPNGLGHSLQAPGIAGKQQHMGAGAAIALGERRADAA